MSENTSQSLRSLVFQSAQIEDRLLENGGELTPDLEQQLAILDVATPIKIDNYYGLMERFDVLQELFEKKSADMARVAQSFKNANARLKENLKNAMAIAQTNELQGNDYRFKLVATPPAVIIENEDAVPAAYKTVIPETYKTDKKRIAEDLKLGVPVEGCRLEQGVTLRKCLNTAGRK